MNKLLAAAVALPAALAALSGCSTYDDYGYGSVGVGYSSGYPGYYRPNGPPPGYGYGYGNPGYYAPYGYYDAYYDNFYGPIYGGFWHHDGFFYYQSYSNGPWYCDYNRHFRRDHFNGASSVRIGDYRNEEKRRFLEGTGTGTNVTSYLNSAPGVQQDGRGERNGRGKQWPQFQGQGQPQGQPPGQPQGQPGAQPSPSPQASPPGFGGMIRGMRDRARERSAGNPDDGERGSRPANDGPRSEPPRREPMSGPSGGGGRGGGSPGGFEGKRGRNR